MSCKACEEFQQSDKTTYIRWFYADVEIRACPKHLEEIFYVLRDAQRREALWRKKHPQQLIDIME